jgi:hypothetical protein
MKMAISTNITPTIISLLTSFSKVLENALYNRLIEYLSNNNVLVENQFGFRKGYATDNAIFKLIKF